MSARPVTRRTTVAIALAVAALTGTAFVPQAFADPTATPTTPTPAATATASQTRATITGTLDAPDTFNDTPIVNVHTAPGMAIEISIQQRGGGWGQIAEKTTDAQGNATAQFSWPKNGYKPGVTYDVVAKNADGATWTAHFVGPKLDDPAVRLDVRIQLPTNPAGEVVVTVTGARPGANVEAYAGRPNKEQKASAATAVADADGRVVLRLRAPESGWVAGAEYSYFVYELTSGRSAAATGQFRVPTWGKNATKPGTAPKAKDTRGGIAKTGV